MAVVPTLRLAPKREDENDDDDDDDDDSPAGPVINSNDELADALNEIYNSADDPELPELFVDKDLSQFRTGALVHTHKSEYYILDPRDPNQQLRLNKKQRRRAEDYGELPPIHADAIKQARLLPPILTVPTNDSPRPNFLTVVMRQPTRFVGHREPWSEHDARELRARALSEPADGYHVVQYNFFRRAALTHDELTPAEEYLVSQLPIPQRARTIDIQQPDPKCALEIHAEFWIRVVDQRPSGMRFLDNQINWHDADAMHTLKRIGPKKEDAGPFRTHWLPKAAAFIVSNQYEEFLRTRTEAVNPWAQHRPLAYAVANVEPTLIARHFAATGITLARLLTWRPLAHHVMASRAEELGAYESVAQPVTPTPEPRITDPGFTDLLAAGLPLSRNRSAAPTGSATLDTPARTTEPPSSTSEPTASPTTLTELNRPDEPKDGEDNMVTE